MTVQKKTAAALASLALAVGMVALAPAASADNYAPQLPSNTLPAGATVKPVIVGAQPGCRVTFSVRNVGGSDKVNLGLLARDRVRVGADGSAKGSVVLPTKAGRYLLITRVDGPGCTPTKSVQRIRITA